MNELCNDDRFEIIEQAKSDLIRCTNINHSPDEMKVLDDFLFRCWQMGWLQTKSIWHDYNKVKPEYGIEVIGYNFNWINPDFNPNGTRVGFRNGDDSFQSAYYSNECDSYYNIDESTKEDECFSKNVRENINPTFWTSLPIMSLKYK